MEHGQYTDNLPESSTTSTCAAYVRKLLHIKWQDKVPDTEILEQTGIKSVYVYHAPQARWAGHVARMPNHRLPKQIFYEELWDSKRTVGGQKNRYKNSLNATFKELQIDFNTGRSKPKTVSAGYDGHLTAESKPDPEGKRSKNCPKECSIKQHTSSFLSTVGSTLQIENRPGEPPQIAQTLNRRQEAWS